MTTEQTVHANEIEKGRCYITKEGHIRRVQQVYWNGDVDYLYRKPSADASPWRGGQLDVRTFAAEAEREVVCDPWTEIVGTPSK